MAKQIIRKTARSIIVTLNILAGLCFLFSCYGNSIFNGKFWFLGLLSSAGFYLLIINLLFLVFWLFIKPVRSLFSFIVLIICWSPIKEIFPLHVKNEFLFNKKNSIIRVMSWNVELFNILEYKSHPEKKVQMFELINQINPDVVCFQEMVAGDSLSKCINNIAEFPNKIGLKNFYYSFNPMFDFDTKHHFGIIIFSKYPIIKKETVTLNPYNYNSTFQYIDIVKNNDTFRVVNIHLQTLRLSEHNRIYLNHPSMSDENDIIESKNILSKYKIGIVNRHMQSDFIKKNLSESPYPVILCGDFNDVPNSYAYNTIGEGMLNAFTEKGFGVGATFDGISPALRIDNIFVDKHFEVLQYKRIEKKLSDHFPIISDLLYHQKIAEN